MLFRGFVRKATVFVGGAVLLSGVSFAGGGAGSYGPPLDHTLMGFKEHGAWYFLCAAPVYPHRIGPHYLTYGPPPPNCGPVPHQYPAAQPPRQKKDR